MKKEKYNCKNCGRCCGPIRFTLKQIIKVNRYLFDNPDIMKEVKKRLPLTEGKCLFLNEKNECSIYPVRPEICRCFGIEGIEELECPLGCASNITKEEAEKLLETYSVYQIYDLIDTRAYYSYLLNIFGK